MKIHTKNGDKQTMETIYMNKNELSLLLNNKPEQIQNFINEFEMNIKLREKGLLSLDGMFRFLNKSLNRISIKVYEICYYPNILILLIHLILVKYIKI
jgi:hypothetical protein